MTERVHYSDAVLHTPAHLNPVRLVNILSQRYTVTQGKFKTNLLIRYLPNVSTETTGTVAFGISQTPHTTVAQIAALQPNYVGPVWKPATLNVPKSLLNLQSWSTADSQCLYLVAANIKGTIAITTTLALTATTKILARPSEYEPLRDLAKLTTHLFVGPRLEGFSLACCAPANIQGWDGNGISMNLDLTRAKGYSSRTSFGLRTPDRKPYLAVRFGIGSSYDWNYNTENQGYSWTRQQLYSYATKDASPGGLTQSYIATTRPINGSTSWWCDVKPRRTTGTIAGTSTTWYYPFCLLVLYYYYPGVDIFAADFTPNLLAHPDSRLPSPPGEAVPNTEQSVPLLMATTQLLWSPYWSPIAEPRQFRQLFSAKNALLNWPVEFS